jgi:nitrite reductase/ring-hydroxylating ferredoxin subunit
MPEINRRQFIAAAVAATCVMCRHRLADAQTTVPASQPSGKVVDVGPRSEYAADGNSDKFIASDHIVVSRENGKIFASSSHCTHTTGEVRVEPGRLYCPRHKGVYSPEGTPVSGPPKVALPRFAVSVDSRGHVIVDTSTQFPAEKWTDPASYIAV